jgi:anti-anti-sigma regulatory factor
LAAGATKSLFIDWSLAEHVDACVLQVLLSQYKLLKTHSLSLYVANDNPDVRGYLALSGLSEYFPPRGNTPTPNLGETNNV